MAEGLEQEKRAMTLNSRNFCLIFPIPLTELMGIDNNVKRSEENVFSVLVNGHCAISHEMAISNGLGR